MYDLTLSPEMARDFLVFQEELANKVISSIRKYFANNSETIANGFAVMSGNFSGLMNRN